MDKEYKEYMNQAINDGIKKYMLMGIKDQKLLADLVSLDVDFFSHLYFHRVSLEEYLNEIMNRSFEDRNK